MSTAIKVKLNTLYNVHAASERTPEHYTPATIEIFKAGSAVTIRATTNPDFDDGYADVPVVTTDAVAGEVYLCESDRAVKFISFSCSDSTAEIYVSGFVMDEVQNQ